MIIFIKRMGEGRERGKKKTFQHCPGQESLINMNSTV